MTTPVFAAARTIPAHRRWLMLLRREVWEHRGSFVWAPLVVGGSFVLLMWIGVVFGKFHIGAGINFNGIPINQSGTPVPMLDNLANYPPDLLQRLASVMDQSVFIATVPVFATLAFSVFFYCLGALYDDRRDRSVLFWASLPVSDVETVLSKVVSATVVAPLLALLAAIGVMAGFWLGLVLFSVFNGWQLLHLLWDISHPFRLLLAQIAALPVYALWLLPVVGWLLLCSAFARSKPFLWAVMVPALIGLFALALDGLNVTGNLWGVWQDWILRPFWSLFLPVLTWLDLPAGVRWEAALVDPLHLWRGLSRIQLWVGAIAGAGMIAAAIALRRWREAE